MGYDKAVKFVWRGRWPEKVFPRNRIADHTSILELIHSDICGPMQTRTPGNKRYILTLIDDYSRYTFVYFMAHKSEVPDHISNFIQWMKTKFKKTPKYIRSYRGKEYMNRQIQGMLKKEGIESQYTTTYIPEQNEVAERNNRSLLEMARCLLFEGSLPNKYWAEAERRLRGIMARFYT